jgi:hypothetical protein
VCVCLIVCDIETSTMRWPGHELGYRAKEKKIGKFNICYSHINFNLIKPTTQNTF